MLITHLYEFFGLLAGCTMVGKGAFPAYGGDTNMASVHKFMDLNPLQLGYFITQVGTAAASFGVATADVTALGMALQTLFDYRCAAPAAIVPGAALESQSICQADSCPIAPNSTCANTPNATVPIYNNGSSFTATGSASSTSATTSSTKKSGSGTLTVSSVLGAAIVFAMGLAL
jgi:hypothetical protein